MPIERIILGEAAWQKLHADYDGHRSRDGIEEIGWVLLGLRDGVDAIVLHAIPGGAHEHSSLTSVGFDADAQILACRKLRELDKRLRVVGLAHTHPGDQRRPSGADRAADLEWIAELTEREAVFGIGTVGRGAGRFDWYALHHGDRDYREVALRLASRYL